MLQLSVSNLLFTIINLVVFYLLLKKFLIKPVTNIMEKREKMIADGLNNASAAQEEAAQMKQEYTAALAGAKEESVKIVEKAQTQAKAEYDRIVAEADEKAGSLLDSAKSNIQLEQEQTKKALQSEIAGLAMAAATKIVSEKTENQGNQGIYNQFLEEVGDAHEDPDND
ncbi:F0F1 ATP synthase subunit B [Muricomes intestini]|uniref:ATP synthase subunit b n=1 Tax=Muricomes intestini TaxID=1796634 RepID=A0A4R3K847_9FIRM|nr:F0F1 ATP synthase subunit B [Muricomes intestini]TCS78811.1 F-type H+-transporting ATPase subunit b [Muricomes intestini]HAX50736.1 ATP synthase F0 subunit B [Lachnospiraceae bacterium]HCR83727.1 ATP synthase F0 subunit B [Lachnospiraceae bacterium]